MACDSYTHAETMDGSHVGVGVVGMSAGCQYCRRAPASTHAVGVNTHCQHRGGLSVRTEAGCLSAPRRAVDMSARCRHRRALYPPRGVDNPLTVSTTPSRRERPRPTVDTALVCQEHCHPRKARPLGHPLPRARSRAQWRVRALSALAPAQWRERPQQSLRPLSGVCEPCQPLRPLMRPA